MIITISLLYQLIGLLQPSDSQIAVYLYVGHSDSLVTATVKVNSHRVSFDKDRRQYLVKSSLLQRQGNVLTISKEPFYPQKLDLDSIFKANARREGVTSSVKLRHPTDGYYVQNNYPKPGTVSQTTIMITGVNDSAAVLNAVKGHNLMVMRAYNYCTKEAENPDTYVLMHCYGAPLQKIGSSALTALRGQFGADKVGPVMVVEGSARILTAQLQIRLRDDMTTAEVRATLGSYGLSEYYRDQYEPRLVIATAGIGMGDHILGIAHQLVKDRKFSLVENIVVSPVCPTK